MAKINPHIPLLAEHYGIVFPGATDYLPRFGMDGAPTNALQSPLVTQMNQGIPAFLVTMIDPEVTRILTTPPKAAEILGEAKKGDWTTKVDLFPVVESVGEVSSYGDFSTNGMANANINWVSRQSYHFEAQTRWGDLELENAGKGKIDLAAEKNIACAHLFAKALNKSYFFGVDGLENYGLLNDPSLSPSLAPTKAWSGATGVEIVADINRLYQQLQIQMPDMIEPDAEMVLALSPKILPYLSVPMQNVYGTSSVKAYLKDLFPNMEVKTAAEYSLAAGELVQLIAKNVMGQQTGFCAFTEKMRAHAIVRMSSYTEQKKSAGTWGAVIKQPGAIASMIGV